MATNGNYANYASGGNYATLNEANYRLKEAPRVANCQQVVGPLTYSSPKQTRYTSAPAYAPAYAQAYAQAYAPACNKPMSRYATQLNNLKASEKRYSTGSMCGSNSTCNLSNNYASLETPLTTSEVYAAGPYNNFGWDSVNTISRYNVQQSNVPTPSSNYSTICVEGGVSCSRY
jgi:hypothetical protein